MNQIVKILSSIVIHHRRGKLLKSHCQAGIPGRWLEGITHKKATELDPILAIRKATLTTLPPTSASRLRLGWLFVQSDLYYIAPSFA